MCTPLLITNKNNQYYTSMLMRFIDMPPAFGFRLPQDMAEVVRYQKVLVTEVWLL